MSFDAVWLKPLNPATGGAMGNIPKRLISANRRQTAACRRKYPELTMLESPVILEEPLKLPLVPSRAVRLQ